MLAEGFGVAHRDLFQRLDAVRGKGGCDHGDPLHALLGEIDDRLDRVGLQPLRPAETRLKRRHQLAVVPAELLLEKAARLHRVAVIGIALLEIALRHPVIGGKDQLRLEVERGDAFGQRLCQRVDIGRLIVIGGKHPNRRLPAHLAERSRYAVDNRCRRRRAILRIERRDQNTVAAFRLQLPQPVADRWLAVAHRPIDGDARIGEAHQMVELLRLRPRDCPERRFPEFVVPDLLIGLAGGFRPARQDEEMQDRQPDRARNLDHPWVGQELLEVALHRFEVGGVRGSEIDQKHTDAAGGDVWVAFGTH